MAGCVWKNRKFNKFIKYFMLLLSVSFLCYTVVKAEHRGDGDSFFGESNEFCQGPECKPKVAESVKEEKSENVNKPDANSSQQQPEINVMITFTKAAGNVPFHRKFELTVTSLLRHASVPVALHILGDPESQKIASEIIKTKAQPTAKSKFRV